jgi:hypothetical protein
MSFSLFEVDSFLFNIMHFSFKIMSLPLLTNDRFKSGSILNPFYHTSGARQWNNSIRAQT